MSTLSRVSKSTKKLKTNHKYKTYKWQNLGKSHDKCVSMQTLLKFDDLTTLSLTIFWKFKLINTSSRSSKIIDIGVNRKRICNSLLVINSNFGRTSCSFRDIDTFSYKIACFFPPDHCLTPPRGTINIIYISLKSTFSGLQFCWRHYGSIFIRLAIVAFQNREITRNSDKIWPYSSYIQGHRSWCQSQAHMWLPISH